LEEGAALERLCPSESEQLALAAQLVHRFRGCAARLHRAYGHYLREIDGRVGGVTILAPADAEGLRARRADVSQRRGIGLGSGMLLSNEFSFLRTAVELAAADVNRLAIGCTEGFQGFANLLVGERRAGLGFGLADGRQRFARGSFYLRGWQ